MFLAVRCNLKKFTDIAFRFGVNRGSIHKWVYPKRRRSLADGMVAQGRLDAARYNP